MIFWTKTTTKTLRYAVDDVIMPIQTRPSSNEGRWRKATQWNFFILTQFWVRFIVSFRMLCVFLSIFYVWNSACFLLNYLQFYFMSNFIQKLSKLNLELCNFWQFVSFFSSIQVNFMCIFFISNATLVHFWFICLDLCAHCLLHFPCE